MSARDPFSPIAPAGVRVVVLPVGPIKRSHFSRFFDLLSRTNEVRLGDVSADGRPDRSMFSPLNFPDGVIFYDYATSYPPPSHLALWPFETFREPYVLLGVADWAQYASKERSVDQHLSDAKETQPIVTLDYFETIICDLRERYSKVLLHKILLLDSPLGPSQDSHVDGLVHVPPTERRNSTTIKTIICDITSSLLAEMTTLAKSLQALPSVASPVQNQKPLNGGPVSRLFQDATLVRTNSLGAANGAARARSASPAIHDDVNLHRMSMPALASNSSAASSPTRDSRPMSPDIGLRNVPAKTFEEITASSSVPELNKINSKRSASQERVSVQGFGSGSLDEWNRNKGQCRIGIVIASLYLQAGRWRDAMKGFVDNALKARAFSDHLWHAKALESILVCMVLLSRFEFDFEIPPVCYAIPDRSSKSIQNTSLSSVSGVPTPAAPQSSRTVDLRALSQVISDLANMIISIYTRPLSVTGESLPELAFSETVIRLSKILAAVHLGGGSLHSQLLQDLLSDPPRTARRSELEVCRLTITPTRSSVESILLRAYPAMDEASELSSLDRVTILAGMASVFATLGLQRKNALLVLDYIEALTLAIRENKKLDAAQAGYHPSASITSFAPVVSSVESSNDPSGAADRAEIGLENIMNLLCRVHGIPEAKWSKTVGFQALHGDLANGGTEDEADAMNHSYATLAPIPDMLAGTFLLRSFGSVNIKADVLRACIRLCEELSDIRGLLHYSAALLRTAGPGISASFDSVDSMVTLSREEQLSLVNAITKTVANAQMVGIPDEAEFWDEFLVRGLYVLDLPPDKALQRQAHSDLNKPKDKGGPESTFKLVHNPFAGKTPATERNDLVVAGEEREFVITLQNPYEFEVEVESAKILSGDTEVGSSNHGFLLRPSRTQSFSLRGTAVTSGSLSIDTCMIKIRGCRERRFSIFSEVWTPAPEVKMKSVGSLKPRSMKTRPQSDESTYSPSGQTTVSPFPPPSVLTLTVIPPQPDISITCNASSQSAMMLLEGERRKISISLTNRSGTVSADYLRFSLSDPSSTAAMEVIANGAVPPPELHELEYQIIHHPACRLCGEIPLSLAADETKDLEFEILGKPGLTSVTVTFDYANTSTPHVEDKAIFFSRRIALTLYITVNATMQLHRFDVLPLSGRSALPSSTHPKRFSDAIANSSLITQIRPTSDEAPAECFLAVLDLRNGWPAPIRASVSVRPSFHGTDHASDSPSQSIQELIQPGHVSRFVLLMPRLYLTDPHRRIKPLSREHERQFVVSAASAAPEVERVNRELFWYREALLEILHAQWSLEGNERMGNIDLRALRLSPRMLDVIRLDDLSVEFEVLTSDNLVHSPRRVSHSAFETQVEEDLILRTTLSNRSDKTIYPLLRLRPSWMYAHPDQHIDLGKRLIWDGVLQKTFPPIGPGQAASSDTAMCINCSGEVEIVAVVEEYRICKSSDEGEDRGMPRAGTGAVPDAVEDMTGRRTWTSNRPCHIIVKDT